MPGLVRTLLLLLLATLLSACGGNGPRGGATAFSGRQADNTRIDAIDGMRIILLADASLLAGLSDPPTATYDDGTTLGITLARVAADTLAPLPQPVDPRRPTVHVTTWLSDAATRWSSASITIEEARRDPRGVVLVVDAPPTTRTDRALSVGSSGQVNVVQRTPTTASSDAPKPRSATLRLGSTKRKVQIIPSVQTRALSDPQAWTAPWTPTLPDSAATDPTMRALLEHEAGSPFTRWRSRLARDGLAPDRLPPADPDGIIEELARQEEMRWQEAFFRLHALDPNLLAALRQRLAGTSSFGAGTLWAPTWEPSSQASALLLDDLLRPDIDDARRLARVRQWLADQPEALAWVVDDAGVLIDGKSQQGGVPQPWMSVQIVNLREKPVNAWVAAAGQPAPEELQALDAWGSAVVLCPASTESDGESPNARLAAPRSSKARAKANLALGFGSAKIFDACAGSWRQELAVLDCPLAVSPPGFTTAKFFADWNLPTLRARTPRLADEAWSTAAILHRAPTLDTSGCETESPGPWQVFVECRNPTINDFLDTRRRGLDTGNNDTLWVFLGSTGSPAYVWRINPTGGAVFRGGETSSRSAQSVTPCLVQTDPLSDRWAVRLTLPQDAVAAHGLLQIGIVRVDPHGLRSAWPRPMLPWQEEPGRAALDLAAWGE